MLQEAACNVYLIKQKKKKLRGLIIDFIYILYIYIFLFSRSLSCALARLSHLLSFIFLCNVTKMVIGQKLQSPKTN